MRVRRIATASEELAARIIRTVLGGTEWNVALKLPVQVAIDRGAQGLSADEFSLYTRGHFDFVVYREADHVPKFAVEFDGFGHETHRQIARDVIKNRFCAQAGLPLLRMGIAELGANAEIGALEWLVERFVAWEERGSKAGDGADRRGIWIRGRIGRVHTPVWLSTSTARTHSRATSTRSSVCMTGSASLRSSRITPARRRQRATYSNSNGLPRRRSKDAPTCAYMAVAVPATLRRQGRTNETLLAVSGRGRLAWANKISHLARTGDAAAGLRLTAKQWAERGLAPQVLPWLNPLSIGFEVALRHVARLGRAMGGAESPQGSDVGSAAQRGSIVKANRP